MFTTPQTRTADGTPQKATRVIFAPHAIAMAIGLQNLGGASHLNAQSVRARSTGHGPAGSAGGVEHGSPARKRFGEYNIKEQMRLFN